MGYDELRLNYQQPAPDQMPGGLFGGGGGGGMFGRMMGGGAGGQQPPANQYQQPMNNGNNNRGSYQGYDMNPNIPSQNQNQSRSSGKSGKFQAFQGNAHTLND